MRLRAVFLDVGNTLLTERPSRYAIYAEAARRRGVEIDAEAMKEHMRSAHARLPLEIEGAFRYSDPWFRAFIRAIFGEDLGLAPPIVAEITEELFARFEDARTFRIFEGARELLVRLREEGLVLGVISNWSARLPRVLAAMELDEAFDLVLCSAIERMEKPSPAIFRAALERAGVAPGEALHAGDHPARDVGGALAAGLAAVQVDHSGLAAGVEGVPRVSGLPELLTVILGRCR